MPLLSKAAVTNLLIKYSSDHCKNLHDFHTNNMYIFEILKIMYNLTIQKESVNFLVCVFSGCFLYSNGFGAEKRNAVAEKKSNINMF